MKLVLLKDDKRFGKKGDVIHASDGYAQNYIIPQGIAIVATGTALNEAKQLKQSQQHKADVVLQEAYALAKQVANTPVTLFIKVGENGKVFGSVTAREIAEALSEKGVQIDKKKIMLGQPIKQIGTQTIKTKLHPQVTAKITVSVVAE